MNAWTRRHAQCRIECVADDARYEVRSPNGFTFRQRSALARQARKGALAACLGRQRWWDSRFPSSNTTRYPMNNEHATLALEGARQPNPWSRAIFVLGRNLMAVIQDQPNMLVARPWQIPSRAATFVGITAFLVWVANSLLVTFLDGRPVRVILLEAWRTRRQEQWPQSIWTRLAPTGFR
jgi:hypothetical protein